MKRELFCAFLCLSLCLVAFSASAGDQGLLNLLDSHMEPEKDKAAQGSGDKTAKGKGSMVTQLGDHLQANLRLRFVHYPDTPTLFVIDPDKDENEAEALLRWSTWTEKGLFSFHASGWFEAGTQEDTYRGVSPVLEDTSRKRRYAELNELYMVRSGGHGDLTLGKKVFHNGVASIFSPANRYSSLDLTDPMDPKVFGSWMASYDHFIGDTTLTFSVLPVFQPKKLPGLWSRWVDTGLTGDIPDLSQYSEEDIETGNALIDDSPFRFTLPSGAQEDMLYLMHFFWGLFFADEAASGELREQSERLLGAIQNSNLSPVEELPDSGLKDAGWFGRVKHSIGLWDLFLSSYYGPGLYPVLRLERRNNLLVLVKENPDVFNVCGGFSTTWKSFELHGEVLYNASVNHKDESYIKGIIGITYSNQDLARALHLRRIDLTLEYADEYVTHKQTERGYIATSRYLRIGREDLFATLRIGVTDDLSVYAGLDEVFWCDSRFYRVGAQYRIMQGLTIDVAAEQFEGPFYSYYGHWSENDRLISMLTWSF
ncbi:MAG: hypothetical protein PVG49_15865 [Desulfobacteraceae bacterium]|jgi:hypothetical protein